MTQAEKLSAAAKPVRTSSLVVSAASNYAAMGTRLLVLLFLTPYLIDNLGKGSYGIWTLVVNLVGYAGVLDLGVSRAIERYVARYAGQGDDDAVNRILGTAIAFYGCAGLLVGFVLGFGADFFADWLNVPEVKRNAFRAVMWISGANCVLGMLAGVIKQGLIGREAFVAANAVMVVSQVGLAVLTFFAVELSWGLQGVAWALAGTTFATGIMYLCLVRRIFPQTRFSPRRFQWATLHSLWSFGLFSIVWVVGDQLRFRVSPLIISRYVSLETVTVFTVGAMVVNQVAMLFVTGCGVLGPRFSSLDGQNADLKFRSLFLDASGLTSLLSALAFGFAVLFGDTILRIWIGGDIDESFRVLLILAAGNSITRAQAAASPALYAKNKHRMFACVMLIEGVFNVGLSCLLVRRWGVQGVAIGVSIPMILVGTSVLPAYICHVTGVKLRTYYFNIVLKHCVAMIVAYAGSWMARSLLDGWLVSVVPACVWLAGVVILFRKECKDAAAIGSAKLRAMRARFVPKANEA